MVGFLSILVVLLGTYGMIFCSLSDENGNIMVTTQTVSDTLPVSTISPPFDHAAISRERTKIVIGSIVYENGRIARIGLLLPEELTAASVSVRGRTLEIPSFEQEIGITRIMLPADLQSQQVDLLFHVGSKQASCSISMKRIGIPVGDCIW